MDYFVADLERLLECEVTVRGRKLPFTRSSQAEKELFDMVWATTNDAVGCLVVDPKSGLQTLEDVLLAHLKRVGDLRSPSFLPADTDAITNNNDLVALTLIKIDDFADGWDVSPLNPRTLVLLWDKAMDCRVELAGAFTRLLSDPDDALKVQASRLARHAAYAMHEKSDTGKAKRFVRECWTEWERQPAKYRSAAAFARDMLDKFPDALTSEIVVTRWVRDWRRES